MLFVFCLLLGLIAYHCHVLQECEPACMHSSDNDGRLGLFCAGLEVSRHIICQALQRSLDQRLQDSIPFPRQRPRAMSHLAPCCMPGVKMILGIGFATWLALGAARGRQLPTIAIIPCRCYTF